MRLLLQTILTFVKQDFHFLYYLAGLVIIALIVYLNYFLEGSFFIPLTIYGLDSTPMKFLFFFFFYAFIYLFLLLVISWFKNEYHFWQKKRFYGKVVFFFSLLSFIRVYPHDLLKNFYASIEIPKSLTIYFLDVGIFYSSSLITLLALLAFHWLNSFNKENLGSFYGLGWKNLAPIVKIYIPLFVFSIFLVVLANLNESIQRHYPLYRDYGMAKEYGIAVWKSLTLFEVGYGFFLFQIELLFRGFLVLSLSRELKGKAIFPASIVYGLVHLGKPLAECLSSVLGGYVLGIVAYKHKSIWLGVLVHVVLAWSMEFTAFFLKRLEY